MRRPTLLLLAITLLCLVGAGEPVVAHAQGDRIPVFYSGPDGGVLTALRLAEDLELVSSPEQARVLFLNGSLPPELDLNALVQQGAGAIFILGPHVTAAQLKPIFGEPIQVESLDSPLSLSPARGVADPLLVQIAWNSAPQVRQRAAISPLGPAFEPLVTGFEDGATVLARRVGPGGPVFLFTPYLDGVNPQIQEWAYFNYFIYALAMRAAGEEPLSFSAYPASPVPHPAERAVLFTFLLGTLVIAGVVFIAVRRYSLAHPEALDVLVAQPETFELRQAGSDWDAIGFHRPLGGFLLALMLGLVGFIPLIIYQNLVLPVYILPSAQALGIWGRVTQFFNLLWLFFDMGTSAAFIKFFAQYRVHNPRHAIQYGQIFVWWQALSGAAQVAVITLVAGAALPNTVYALYTWSIIIHTLIQVPGFYQVMRHALMAWQRFDYAQILDLALYLFFPILAQPLIVTLMVAWGRNHPVFGGAMGGLFGLGLAAYASEALTFLIGLWLYRRLGYNTRLLFMAHFDWATVVSAFRFGVFEMLGSVAWAVGQAAEVLITQTRLVNYTEVWGNWVLAQNFVFAFNVLDTLYNNLMPSISEAISHAGRALSQYYAAMGYKWGALVSAFIGSVLLAVADRFILGASGPEFVRAAAYAVPLILWGAIQYPSWVGDQVQLGSNRPYLKTALVAGEQGIRVVLALLLVARLQINALILAYFTGLLAKGLASYFINDRLCFPQRFYAWQSLAAPLLAGSAHYIFLRWLTGLIWQGDQVTSVIIFFIGILPSFPLFAFFYGLFGGWDAGTLEELGHAAQLSSFMRPLAWLFWAATSTGARLSPLTGRFPIRIREAALMEARALTQEKVELV